MTTLVTAATGKVGRHVVDELTRLGLPARPASRRSAIPLDWADPGTWETALNGVDQIFLVLPGGDDGHRSVTGLGAEVIRFLKEAERRGASRIVLMTAMGVGYAPDDADQRAVELHVQHSSVQWTIVRPNWFHQNVTEGPLRDLADAQRGVLTLPAGDASVSFVDARDIAAVVGAALTEDHHGREYALTGPESLTFTELAAEAARAGLPVTQYRPVAEADFRDLVRSLGWEPDYVDTLCQLFATIAAGHAAHLSADVAEVLGRAPISFAEFATTG
jgi:uncharacterized protein YbjT (DUF2867 family)